MTDSVLIVGATSDIGKAIAKLLLLQGHRVILVGRSDVKLKQLSIDLALSSEYFYNFDVLNIEFVDDLFADIVKLHGKLNAMVSILRLRIIDSLVLY